MGEAPDLDEMLKDLDKQENKQAEHGGHRVQATKQRDPNGEYTMLSVADIVRDPDQPRTTFKNIDELASSMKANGLIQPITVRVDAEGTYVLMYGERRLRAAQMLNWSHIPTMIRKNVVDTSILERQLVENFSREPMDPVDEARGLRRFMRTNKVATAREAGKRLGRSEGWCAQRLDLLALSEQDQEAVSEGSMSLGIASTKAKAAGGRLREGSAAYDTAMAHGLIPASKDRVPQRRGSTLSSDPSSAAAAAAKRSYRSLNTHFSDEHPLAGRASSRCRAGATRDPRSEHSLKIGGIACGACWETVIRMDVLSGNHDLSAVNRADD